ncbi:MAG: adenylate/guanylate cyclase domain-containing protein [Reyranellaceae bacterium]
MQRRICAILAVDVAGYSRLTELDEEGTHRRLMQVRREVMEPVVAAWHGTIVKHTGDGFLASFDNAVDGASCAVELQRALGERSAHDAADRRLAFRMGLNVADAILDADDIFGEGVNVAARLQGYAEPGGIVVTESVARQIEGRLDIRRVDLGELHLKNIRRPVHAYSLHPHGVPLAEFSAGRRSDIRPSIAVLPFRRHLTEEAEGYFADGVVDDIIRMLSTFQDLVVIARGSTLGLGGERVDASEIGRRLGVRYVLNGGVVRAGGKIRINVDLTDAESGAVVWAERYDGDVTDIFSLQDRISLQVATTLAPNIRQQELKRALRKHPDSMDAYDLVLQAIDLLYRMEYRAFSGARGLLQQARVADENYAPAWTYAAQWHTFRIGQGWTTDMHADTAEAERLATMAIELDRNDATALAVCGHARSFLLHDYDAGAQLLERALREGPSCALAWTLASCTSSYRGEGPEAVERAEHSLRLSPRDPLAFFYLCNTGIAHYANGDYAQAVLFARRAAGQKRTFRANLRMLAAGLVALGRIDEARATSATLMEVDPDFRLGRYRELCPWQDGATRETFIDRLRQSGLPA